MWIVVSRPRTVSDLRDWETAEFFGPFEDEKAADKFAVERDMGKEEKSLSLVVELLAPKAFR